MKSRVQATPEAIPTPASATTAAAWSAGVPIRYALAITAVGNGTTEELEALLRDMFATVRIAPAIHDDALSGAA